MPRVVLRLLYSVLWGRAHDSHSDVPEYKPRKVIPTAIRPNIHPMILSGVDATSRLTIWFLASPITARFARSVSTNSRDRFARSSTIRFAVPQLRLPGDTSATTASCTPVKSRIRSERCQYPASSGCEVSCCETWKRKQGGLTCLDAE